MADKSVGAASVAAPTDLAPLVERVSYKPGWVLKVAGPGGRFLCVHAVTADSNDPRQIRRTQHMFEVPADARDVRAWARWIFECLLLVEQHEAGEFFTLDTRRPFFPYHEDEGSPYARVERWEDPSP